MTKPTQSRELILDILMEILEKGGYSHVVLRQALEKYQYLEKQDRALITRITEGTIEYRMTIDQVLNQCSKVPVEKMKPVIRTILRMSVYQIFWMDRIPDRAVCSEAVNLAVRRRFSGLKGFVNGVLRTIIREKDSFDFSDLSLRYSMPSWLIDMWQREYDSETVESMLRAFLEDRPTSEMCIRDSLWRRCGCRSCHCGNDSLHEYADGISGAGRQPFYRRSSCGFYGLFLYCSDRHHDGASCADEWNRNRRLSDL